MASPPQEIERKFLVAQPPHGLKDYPRKKIRQGYVAVTEGGTEVRVRKEGQRHVLTIKEGHGQDRGETEIEIRRAHFAALWPLTRGRRLEKVRYRVHQGDQTIEVDVYRRKLKGLTIAEVEFDDDSAALDFHPPEWFGPEVTGDENYSNQDLASHGMPQE